MLPLTTTILAEYLHVAPHLDPHLALLLSLPPWCGCFVFVVMVCPTVVPVVLSMTIVCFFAVGCWYPPSCCDYMLGVVAFFPLFFFHFDSATLCFAYYVLRYLLSFAYMWRLLAFVWKGPFGHTQLSFYPCLSLHFVLVDFKVFGHVLMALSVYLKQHTSIKKVVAILEHSCHGHPSSLEWFSNLVGSLSS